MVANVGIIGIGLVGTALSELLMEGKYGVGGHDVLPEANRRLAELGGHVHDSNADVFRHHDIVILCLPTSEIVKTVLAEAGGAIRKATLIIDTSTGDPAHSRGFGKQLAARGAGYLDATLGGSSRQIRQHQAICICGGSADDFRKGEALLRLMAVQVFHVGACGAGASMKLVLNLVLGLNRAVLAEGLSYAIAEGIDPVQALEILKAGPAYSRVMDVKGAKMIERKFEPEARLSQHLKDVRLILATGAQAGAWLPLSELHRSLLEAAEKAGFGAADNSAIIEAYRKQNR